MKKFLQKLTLSFGFFIPITGINVEEELNINKDLSGSYKLHTWYNKGEIEMYLGQDQIKKVYPNKESYTKEFGNDSVQNLKCDEELKGDDMNFTMSFDFTDVKKIPPFANITFSEDKSSCTVARKIEFSEKEPDKTVLKGFKYNFKLTLPGKATETTEGYAEGWSKDMPELVGITELKARYAKADAAAVPADGEAKPEGTAEGEKPKEDKKEGMSTGLLIGIAAGALAVIGVVVFIIMKKQKAKEQERLARLQAEEEDGEEGGAPARPSSRFRKPTTRGTVKNTSARLQRPAAGRPGSRPSRPSVPPPIDIDEEEPQQEEELQQEEAPPQPKPQSSPVRRPQAPQVAPRPSASAPAPAPQGAEPMKIIQCPKCQTKLKVKSSLKGKPVQCPKCKNKMMVP